MSESRYILVMDHYVLGNISVQSNYFIPESNNEADILKFSKDLIYAGKYEISKNIFTESEVDSLLGPIHYTYMHSENKIIRYVHFKMIGKFDYINYCSQKIHLLAKHDLIVANIDDVVEKNYSDYICRVLSVPNFIKHCMKQN